MDCEKCNSSFHRSCAYQAQAVDGEDVVNCCKSEVSDTLQTEEQSNQDEISLVDLISKLLKENQELRQEIRSLMEIQKRNEKLFLARHDQIKEEINKKFETETQKLREDIQNIGKINKNKTSMEKQFPPYDNEGNKEILQTETTVEKNLPKVDKLTKKEKTHNVIEEKNGGKKDPNPKSRQESEISQTELTYAEVMKSIIHIEDDMQSNPQRHKDSDFKTISYNKRRYGKLVGTAENSRDDINFKGAPKKLWLFISRVSNEVSEENILNYLASKTKQNKGEFTVTEETSSRTRLPTKSFRVGASFNMKETLYNPTFWPKGVTYGRYKFNINGKPKIDLTKNFTSTIPNTITS